MTRWGKTLGVADKLRLQRGTMVFWDVPTDAASLYSSLRPYWVIEWQPDNGDGCYWIVDGEGNHATAGEDELSLTPQTSRNDAMDEDEGISAAHKLIDLSDPMTTAEERKEAHAAMDAMAAMAKAEKDIE